MAKESRANAAQALYRLGICQQKKGQPAEAAKTFRMLIAEYADPEPMSWRKRRRWFRRRRERSCCPRPGRVERFLELAMKLANGTPVGIVRYSVQSSRTSPDQWLFETRTSTLALQFQTRVEGGQRNDEAGFERLDHLAMIGDVRSRTTAQKR